MDDQMDDQMDQLTRRDAMKKGGRLLFGAAACNVSPLLLSGCTKHQPSQESMAAVRNQTTAVDIDAVKLTIVYDNIPYRSGLQVDWGFACLVEGLDRTILFDAGRYDNIFLRNLTALGIDPQQIEAMVVSHDHPDHIGGVSKIVGQRPAIEVTLVQSFRSGFKSKIENLGGAVVAVKNPATVGQNAFTTGEMEDFVRNEHSLAILTNRGVIVVTGCAHPGVVDMVARAQSIADAPVLLVVGGFHLLSDHAGSIRKKIDSLQQMGVRYACPTHCSGGEARKLFAAAFGPRFLDGGLGRVIRAQDLKT